MHARAACCMQVFVVSSSSIEKSASQSGRPEQNGHVCSSTEYQEQKTTQIRIVKVLHFQSISTLWVWQMVPAV